MSLERNSPRLIPLKEIRVVLPACHCLPICSLILGVSFSVTWFNASVAPNSWSTSDAIAVSVAVAIIAPEFTSTNLYLTSV